jgi:hypothetical protein
MRGLHEQMSKSRVWGRACNVAARLGIKLRIIEGV